jgi:hypothetical protein
MSCFKADEQQSHAQLLKLKGDVGEASLLGFKIFDFKLNSTSACPGHPACCCNINLLPQTKS